MVSSGRQHANGTFRLSEADAFRLKRLMDKCGSGFRYRSDNARFRAMLRGVDCRAWEHLYNSDLEAEAFEENKHVDQLELSQKASPQPNY
jgi:hypothetical protein